MTHPIDRRFFLKSTCAAAALASGPSFVGDMAMAQAPADSVSPNALKPPPAPLFRDPIHDGAADPTLICNREAKAKFTSKKRESSTLFIKTPLVMKTKENITSLKIIKMQCQSDPGYGTMNHTFTHG